MQLLIDVAVPLLNFVLLTAVGLELTPADFDRVRGRRRLVLAGLVAPLLLLPPIAIALTTTFNPAPEIAAGVLLIAACPIGGISNTYSYLARASVALSITLTSLSCLLSVVTIPVLTRVFELVGHDGLYGRPPIPLLLAQLLLMLALPVGLGMALRSRRPLFAERYSGPLTSASFFSVGVLLTLIILSDLPAFVSELSSTVPLAAAFVVCSIAVGWVVGAMLTADPRDRFTLAAEFATRNVAVATAIAVTLLGRVEFARFATTYFLTEVPLMLGAILIFRTFARRQKSHLSV
jgi:BASS family bile acid:Na+ symporter